MVATWEKIEKNKGVLAVEVETEQVAAALDQAFKKVAGKVNVPGFRKGKVPRQIFEARFGVESLYQDALDILLPKAYMDAVEETKIEPVDQPDVDVENFAKGEVLKFKATVIVKPEVELGEYKGLEVAEESAEVTEEEINQELERLQERHAEIVPLEDGTAENGDTVVIDFEGSIDGVPFEGGKAEQHSLELGSNSFIPGFEEQLVGVKKEDELEVTVNFPEDYHAEELKGKESVFQVKVHDIKRKNLPELDDEFAKDVSEFETFEEFKQDLIEKLKKSKEEQAERAKENAVVDKAVENAEVEIPEPMIESELHEMLHDFEHRLQAQGMNLEMYYQFSGQDEAKLREQMQDDAQKRVLNRLVLEAIAASESIEATEEELTDELDKIAESAKLTIEDVRARLLQDGRLTMLTQDVVMRKTVEFLVENSKTAPEVA